MRRTKAIIKYVIWGAIANLALKAYYVSPREALQDEFFTLHRYALKKAHTARMKGVTHD